jgi:hypothetical protein
MVGRLLLLLSLPLFLFLLLALLSSPAFHSEHRALHLACSTSRRGSGFFGVETPTVSSASCGTVLSPLL